MSDKTPEKTELRATVELGTLKVLQRYADEREQSIGATIDDITKTADGRLQAVRRHAKNKAKPAAKKKAAAKKPAAKKKAAAKKPAADKAA